jgi:thiazole synthase ThiGH ThiG subunit
MGKLVRRTLGGDAVVAEWSTDDADSVRAAAEAMRREIDAGYVAVEGGAGRNEPVSDLPPEADLVILTMPMGGG